jgi:hypothetical protein
MELVTSCVFTVVILYMSINVKAYPTVYREMKILSCSQQQKLSAY